VPAVNFLNDHYRKQARLRTRMFGLFCAFWFLAIVVRLVQIQVFSHARYEARVIDQNKGQTPILPRRGTSYDRQGRILAASQPACSVFYRPNAADPIPARIEPIRRLAGTLGLTARDLERIDNEIRSGSRFIWLKRKAEPDVAARAANHKLGIDYQEEAKRFYPLGTLAAQVLGGVTVDGQGISGIELKFNSVLQGRKGLAINLHDALNREYRTEVIIEPVSGRDVTLTLDQTIQFYAESAIRKAVSETGAAWGTAIVSTPHNGEILAMATSPGFDPNNYPAQPEADNNRAVRHLYEPGSTFKIVTAAAALENRVVNLADKFDCSKGSIELAGGPIRDHKLMGVLTFAEVITNSSNIGTIMVGQRLSEDQLYHMIDLFGFGRRTGIELPAEAVSRLNPVEKWSRRSQASLSIGYEIQVTPLQVLQAMNVVANRGKLIPPRIVKSIQGSRPHSSGPTSTLILSSGVGEKLAGILERAVNEGTGLAARPEGYETAGKTGTTQRYDPALKAYSTKRHTASFVGFVPADEPVLSIIVVLDDPRTEEQYGGQLAAPVFREIALRSLRTLGVRPGRALPALRADRRVENQQP
jgi:cell division protein FtsI (penicillin-binding protein 3)